MYVGMDVSVTHDIEPQTHELTHAAMGPNWQGKIARSDWSESASTSGDGRAQPTVAVVAEKDVPATITVMT
jgi:hypothetical protein